MAFGQISIQNRRQQIIAAVLVIMLHATAVALVLLYGFRSSITEAKPGLIALNLANGGARRLNPQLSRPHHLLVAAIVTPAPAPLSKEVEIDFVLPNLALASDGSTQTTSAAIASGCDLTRPVQDALRYSDELRRQLPGISTEFRSVANAIVVWNAGWIDSPSEPEQVAFTTIRRTITQTVAASSPDCRSQIQAGPRLIYLPGGSGQMPGSSNRTIILALGSGQWSWQQLVDGIQPLPAGASEVAAPAAWSKLAAAPAKIVPPEQQTAAASSQAPALKALLAVLVRDRSATALPYSP